MSKLVPLALSGAVVSRRNLADGREEVRVEVQHSDKKRIWIGRAAKER